MSEQLDLSAEAAKREDEWARKNLDHAITFAVEGLKAALLLNGGAAVALLTLVSALAVKEGAKVTFSIEHIKSALSWFGSGVALVSIAFMVAYTSQVFFMSHVNTKSVSHAVVAGTSRIVGVLFFIFSIACFLLGVISSLNGIGLDLKIEQQTPRRLEGICRSWSGLTVSQCK